MTVKYRFDTLTRLNVTEFLEDIIASGFIHCPECSGPVTVTEDKEFLQYVIEAIREFTEEPK